MDAKDIMSITKFNGKYYIYFPNIKDKPIRDKLCRWWGSYDTFDECVSLIIDKNNEYNHFEIDKKLLRRLKLNNIHENSKR